MNEYLKMLIEYKRTESALRKRISELTEEMKKPLEHMERENLEKRKNTLEQELYDMLEVMDKLYDYAGCGRDERCRNA